MQISRRYTRVCAAFVFRIIFGAGAVALGLSWTADARAQDILDAPKHRLDFEVSPGLPKCNDVAAYRGIVTNWIRVHSIDPTASRRIVVRIKALRDRQKRVDLSLLDEEGQAVETETQTYPSDEECFRILYWTAFDTAKLLRRLATRLDEANASKQADNVAKDDKPQEKESVQEKPKECPVVTKVIETSPPRRDEIVQVTQPSRTSFSAGLGVAFGLTSAAMLGARFGVGRVFRSMSFEFDARLFPPIFPISMDDGAEVRPHAYLASGAACLHKLPVVGCFVVSGGVRGYLDDERDERYFVTAVKMIVGAGLRVGAQWSLRRNWAMRFDMDAIVPFYAPGMVGTGSKPVDGFLMPNLGLFVSVLPRF